MNSFFCLWKKVNRKGENTIALLALAYLVAQLVRWHAVGFRIIG